MVLTSNVLLANPEMRHLAPTEIPSMELLFLREAKGTIHVLNNIDAHWEGVKAEVFIELTYEVLTVTITYPLTSERVSNKYPIWKQFHESINRNVYTVMGIPIWLMDLLSKFEILDITEDESHTHVGLRKPIIKG